jgi:YD repeat-containing protein
MSSAHPRVRGRALALAAMTALSLVSGSFAPAATTSYEYDALGRLRVVTHDNRIATTYTLDPAGNRTQLTDVAAGPTSAPASISVPATSATGDYSISWGAAAGTVLAYELYESTSASFATSTRVHNASARTASFSGKPNNSTYYYRVRACANGDCSGFTTGANGVAVFVAPPGAPAAISVPTSSSTGAYAISWSAASGAVQIYELYESTSPSFASATLVRSDSVTSMAFAGKAHGSTYYYRVRACGRGGCSDFSAGGNGVTTTIPPPTAPASITVPATIAFNYLITWGESTGPVSAYELYESTSASFAPQTLKFSGIERIATISNNPNGTYYYRVRACGYTGCSGYTEGATSVVVNTPPPSLPAPTNLAKTHVANCAWRATWNRVDGAASYIVRDTAGAEQRVVEPLAHVACPINNQNANQPRWVKACSPADVCSSAAYFP